MYGMKTGREFILGNIFLARDCILRLRGIEAFIHESISRMAMLDGSQCTLSTSQFIDIYIICCANRIEIFIIYIIFDTMQ